MNLSERALRTGAMSPDFAYSIKYSIVWLTLVQLRTCDLVAGEKGNNQGGFSRAHQQRGLLQLLLST